MVCCKSANETVAASSKQTQVTSPCPVQTDCRFEILKDKSLVVKTDDTGHNYFNIIDAPGKTVLKYTHKKITDANLVDAGYSETLAFEIDDTTKDLNLTGTAIQKTKMVLNIACFCRGKAGVYKIEEGILTYKDNMLHIEIPQLVDGQATRTVDVVVR